VDDSGTATTVCCTGEGVGDRARLGVTWGRGLLGVGEGVFFSGAGVALRVGVETGSPVSTGRVTGMR
jgi:hypothetical protein